MLTFCVLFFEIDCICLDFSKTFDSVNNRLLMQKNWNFRLRGNLYRLIKSHLFHRRQAPRIRDSISRFMMTSSGVPHASHFGPIIYNVFINNIAGYVSGSEFLLNADNSNNLKIVKDLICASKRFGKYVTLV